jgi:predicted protein tyrosine phosphatase
MLLRAPSPPNHNICALISIHGTREFGVEFTCDHRLDLTFDDAELPIPGDNDSLQRHFSRRRWNEEIGLTETPPTPSDAAAIINFAQKIAHLDGTLLCHCLAGISRAPAAALICLTTWRGPGSEAASLADLLRLRPAAQPHAGLIRFADDLLHRNGALISALRDSPR